MTLVDWLKSLDGADWCGLAAAATLLVNGVTRGRSVDGIPLRIVATLHSLGPSLGGVWADWMEPLEAVRARHGMRALPAAAQADPPAST